MFGSFDRTSALRQFNPKRLTRISSLHSVAGEERFGVVSAYNGVLCVSFGGLPPPIGSPISILETHSPQYVFEVVGGNSSANLNVLFDGDKTAMNCHPYWKKKIFSEDGCIAHASQS